MRFARAWSLPSGRCRTATLLLVLVCTVLPAACRGESVDVHSYVPKHRTVEELQPIAVSLIGANGSVSVDHGRNALVLVGEAEVVARLLQVLRERDTPPRTIALEYGFISLRELRRKGPELHWSRASSEYRVGVLNTTDPASSSRWQAHWHRDDEPSRGTIRLQEGSTARLSAIEAKPLYSVFFGGRRRAFGAGFEGLLVGSSHAALIASCQGHKESG